MAEKTKKQNGPVHSRQINAKVVLLGAQGVGKSSTCLQYVNQTFDPYISPTVGASYFTTKISIENVRVKLQIWDTAGQERFQSLIPMYYRNAAAAMLIYDITNMDSFRAINHWIEELQNSSLTDMDSMCLMLLGNKCDNTYLRKVPEDSGKQLANSIGATFMETSACKGIGIKEAFLQLGVAIVEVHRRTKLNTIQSLTISTNRDGSFWNTKNQEWKEPADISSQTQQKNLGIKSLNVERKNSIKLDQAERKKGKCCAGRSESQAPP